MTSHKAMIEKIRKAYADGENIMRFLNKDSNNSIESIMISYELQSGTYLEAYLNDEKERTFRNAYGKQLSSFIRKAGTIESIMEAGIGEATTFLPIIQNSDLQDINKYGCDISWSRTRVAHDFLANHLTNFQMFVADIFEMPLKDNALDVVYTSHAVEPNSGREREILKELYRITNKYLFLFEPDYDIASPEAKKHMEYHGYIKHLYQTAKELEFNVVEYAPLEIYSNKLNPTSAIVIEKNSACNKDVEIFQCPVTATRLKNYGEVYYSKDAHIAYPVLQKIPYLIGSHAILAHKYESQHHNFPV